MIPIRTWNDDQDHYIISLLTNHATTAYGVLSNGTLRIIPDLNNSKFQDVSLVTRNTELITGTCLAHDNNELIWSCSNEGKINCYDFARTGTQPIVSILQSKTNLSCIDAMHTLLACGTESGFESKILFWDIRNVQKPLGSYEESHSDSITKIEFSPNCNCFNLLSGSIDGLINYFDVTKPSETSALQSVFNCGSAISNLGYFGTNFTGIYGTTTTETLSLFELESCSRIVAHENDFIVGKGCRETLQEISGIEINYLVDCIWEAKTQKLLLLSGNSNGGLFGFEVTIDGFNSLGPLSDGHSAVVRCADSVVSNKGLSLITGGEDGKICLWAIKDE